MHAVGGKLEDAQLSSLMMQFLFAVQWSCKE